MATYLVASTARRARGGGAFAAAVDGNASAAVPSGVQHAYVSGAGTTICGIPISALQTFDEAAGFLFETPGHGCPACLDAVA